MSGPGPGPGPGLGPGDAEPPVLRAAGMPMLLAASALAFTGFGLLLPISPDWVLAGGADRFDAGLVTAVLMAFTVLSQLQVNRWLRRFGWTPVLAAGATLLGLPAPAQALSRDLLPVLVSSAVRGVGFGIVTVCGATALTLLVAPAARGRAVGAYGLAVALPQLVSSAGPWLAHRFGTPTVLVLGALPVVACAWVVPLGRRLDQRQREQRPDDAAVSAAERAALPGRVALLGRVWPALLGLALVTSAAGAVTTFAGQLAPSAELATLCLLCLNGASTPTRWAAGAVSDRWPTRWLVGPLLVVAAIGVAAIGLSITMGTGRGLLLLAGSTVLGVAFGPLLAITLLRAFTDGGATLEPRVSVVWNVTFDLGTGVGALLIGAVAQTSTFGGALAVLVVATIAGAASIGLGDRRARAPARDPD